METETKTPSIVYEVSFGAVFKLRHEGKRVLALSIRDRNGYWHPATEIGDDQNVYKDLGLDQCSVVYVLRKDHVRRLKDIFAVTLDYNGDSSTAAKAAKDKVLGEILEKLFLGWLKESGPILVHENGAKSPLWPTDLTAQYDPKDYGALREAYAYEIMEGAEAAQKPVLDEAIARFNAFMDKIQEGDDLFWFEHNEVLAARIGYCILRKGRLVAWHLTMMS